MLKFIKFPFQFWPLFVHVLFFSQNGHYFVTFIFNLENRKTESNRVTIPFCQKSITKCHHFSLHTYDIWKLEISTLTIPCKYYQYQLNFGGNFKIFCPLIKAIMANATQKCLPISLLRPILSSGSLWVVSRILDLQLPRSFISNNGLCPFFWSSVFLVQDLYT